MPSNEIKFNLYKDESVLWEKAEVSNKLKRYQWFFFGNIIILILFISIAVVVLISLIFEMNEREIFELIIIPLSVLALAGIPGYLLLNTIREYRRILSLFEINSNELKEFQEFCILTNKRWIQKAFYFAKFDVFIEIEELVEYEQGIAAISLDELSVIYVFWNRSETKYYVNFFVSWDKWSEESDFVIVLNKEEYTLLMDSIKKVFEITNNEKNVISYRDNAYYVRKID
ncbi:MAG: hypothetical protein GF311_07825 [Candidatus Lokiarchaeota archaeon]|nr:hypothetical protein [Candidatus Lokiarchaeota archaeon]